MIRHVVWACCTVSIVVSIAASASAQTSAKTHELKATPATTFYRFLDAATPPVLTIDSGDSVRLETATGTPGYFERLGVPKQDQRFLERAVAVRLHAPAKLRHQPLLAFCRLLLFEIGRAHV